MKNKITKLSLALLAITFSVQSSNAQSQEPKKVIEATNTEFLLKFAKEKEAYTEKNYQEALEIAAQKGMGATFEKDGKTSVLVGYNEEDGILKYITTYNNVEPGSSIQTANAKPFHEVNFNATGFKVGVWDGGAGLTGHYAFTGGRYIIRDNGNAPSQITADDRDHAAHVAGTIAANSSVAQGTVKGIAPEAIIYAYNYFNDTSEMATAAAASQNKIYVSNHSYGLSLVPYFQNGGSASIFGQYNSDAREYDLIANNAPYYTIVFAAGNDRDSYTQYNPSRNGKDLLTQGGVSKNLVVVAATKGTETFAGTTGSASVSGSNAFIAGFSNYGPTDDYRIKPDIAAKGVGVKSILQTSNTATGTKSGTSMAAPSVTGVFTLWQAYFKENINDYMLSSTVRALMAHTAREAGPALGPDFMFGFGIIDAGKGKAVIDSHIQGTSKIAELDLPQGTTMEYPFYYTGVEPLVATLAWNDPAASATSQTNSSIPRLVNDLDLRVINVDTNTVFFPWALTQNASVSATDTNIAVRTGDNNRDNIEKIEVNSTVPGNYKVVVSHKGNTLSGSTQKYSLIISGAGEEMPDLDGQVSIEQEALDNIKVYPNPTSSVVNISGDVNVLVGSVVEIFDTTGKRVFESNSVFGNYQPSIDVSNFDQGVYIMTISKENAKSTYKFIKK